MGSLLVLFVLLFGYCGCGGERAKGPDLEDEADGLLNAARLEALTVYPGIVTKKTKTGEATYTYWYASWREGGKVKNVHLGSAKKMDMAAAMAKAQKLKPEALGLR